MTMKSSAITFILSCILGATAAVAQFNSFNVPKASGPIVVDGKLTEKDWQTKPLVSEFRPYERIASEIQLTRIWMVQEPDALVIAGECMEEFPNALVAKASHDGSVWTDDHLEFFFDTAGQRQSCVQLLVNSKGTLADGVIRKPNTNPDWSWESEAEVKTTVGADRWCLEMRIPLAVFPQLPTGNDWTFHVARSRYTMNTMHLTSLKGHITSFHDMKAFDFLCGIGSEPTGLVTLSQSFGAMYEGGNTAVVTIKNDNDTAKTVVVQLDVTQSDGSVKSVSDSKSLAPKSQSDIRIPWTCALSQEGKPISMSISLNGKRIQAFSGAQFGIKPVLGALVRNVLYFDNRNPAVAEYDLNYDLSKGEMTVQWELWSEDGSKLAVTGSVLARSNKQLNRIYCTFLKPGLYTLRRYLISTTTKKALAASEEKVELVLSPWND